MNDNKEQDNEVGEDIPEVGKKETDIKKKLFMPCMVALFITGILISVLYSPAEENKKVTDKVDEAYSRERNSGATIPEYIPPKKPKNQENKAQVTKSAEPENPKSDGKRKLTAEERRALREKKALQEKRRRASCVAFNGYNGNGSKNGNGNGNGGTGMHGVGSRESLEKQQSILLNQLEKMTSGSGRSSGSSGRKKDVFSDLKYSAAGMGGSSGLPHYNDGKIEDRLKDVSANDEISAEIMHPEKLSFSILEGTMISAILETAINSSLPGKVRAILDEDVYSQNGDYILIEQGSQVTGEYQSGMEQGQKRIFVIWTRIITPFGVDIRLNSPGTDTLGRSGHKGKINTHFFERFGASLLLSIIGSATAADGSTGNQFEDQMRMNMSNNFNKSAEIALENSINIPPTLDKKNGDRIKIFTAQDVNFKSALLKKRLAMKGGAYDN